MREELQQACVDRKVVDLEMGDLEQDVAIAVQCGVARRGCRELARPRTPSCTRSVSALRECVCQALGAQMSWISAMHCTTVPRGRPMRGWSRFLRCVLRLEQRRRMYAVVEHVRRVDTLVEGFNTWLFEAKPPLAPARNQQLELPPGTELVVVSALSLEYPAGIDQLELESCSLALLLERAAPGSREVARRAAGRVLRGELRIPLDVVDVRTEWRALHQHLFAMPPFVRPIFGGQPDDEPLAATTDLPPP